MAAPEALLFRTAAPEMLLCPLAAPEVLLFTVLTGPKDSGALKALGGTLAGLGKTPGSPEVKGRGHDPAQAGGERRGCICLRGVTGAILWFLLFLPLALLEVSLVS